MKMQFFIQLPPKFLFVFTFFLSGTIFSDDESGKIMEQVPKEIQGVIDNYLKEPTGPFGLNFMKKFCKIDTSC